MLKPILIVGAGSFVGGTLRYLVSLLLKPGGGFPVATFVVNSAGCLLIGLLYGLFTRFSDTSSQWCLLLTTGFCGGFTTFSTFANESLAMLQKGQYGLFAIYIGCSVIAGLLAVWIGYLIAR